MTQLSKRKQTPPLPRPLLDKIRKYESKLQPGPLQEAWLQTLESGTFLQMQGTMCAEVRPDRNEDTGLSDDIRKDYEGCYAFCCLGVAREVLVENGMGPAGEAEELLDKAEAETLGLFSTGGEFCDNHPLESPIYEDTESAELTSLNDNGWTFQQIAWLIRQAPDLVFERSV